MNYYLISGEASGDLHASNLMKAIKGEDVNANFRYWGGDLMQAVGGTLVKHYRELAFMGIWEVVKNLSTISKNLDFCKKDIAQSNPDVLILVDYSGFNLRIAKWAKSVNYKVFYYISPQVWASRQHRVHKIKAYVDRLFVILPFEKDFYKEFGVEVDFVGHPLLDAIAEFEEGSKKDKTAFLPQVTANPIIALLPGSRKQEITKVLKIMLSVVNQFKGYQFVIAKAPAISKEFYENILKGSNIKKETIQLVSNQTYDLLTIAKAAIVTSGTATLETALFEVPQVVVYKGNWGTYQIVKRIIKVKYISLVNLIADRPLVKELLQKELTTSNLAKELSYILEEEKAIELKVAYQALKSKLGNAGASKRAAKLMVTYLKGE